MVILLPSSYQCLFRESNNIILPTCPSVKNLFPEQLEYFFREFEDVSNNLNFLSFLFIHFFINLKSGLLKIYLTLKNVFFGVG